MRRRSGHDGYAVANGLAVSLSFRDGSPARGSDTTYSPAIPMAVTSSSVLIALLTPPGRGALAVVGVAGSGALELVAQRFAPLGRRPLTDRPDGAVIFGLWAHPAGYEELVVVRHAADRLEIHCHGGLAASTAVMASLESLGATRPPGAVFIRCHVSPGSTPDRAEIELEARAALARVGGPKAARILCRQLSGSLASEMERVHSLWQEGDMIAATAAEDRLRQAARIGLRLVEPWRVVVSGPVNAGKSSLVNTLAGFARSIVSAEPGTTRDVVTTRLVLSGWEVDLIDTAGLRPPHETTSTTERIGIERALAAAADADLVLHITEMQPSLAATSATSVHRLTPFQEDAPPCIDVLSKCDLAPGVPAPPGVLRTSGRTGEGIDALIAAIVATLIPEETTDPALLSDAVPFTARQMALLSGCLSAPTGRPFKVEP